MWTKNFFKQNVIGQNVLGRNLIQFDSTHAAISRIALCMGMILPREVETDVSVWCHLSFHCKMHVRIAL